jgi:hypothetical protein
MAYAITRCLEQKRQPVSRGEGEGDEYDFDAKDAPHPSPLPTSTWGEGAKKEHAFALG